MDPDVKCIRDCIKALNRSTSRDVLKANVEYLLDYYFRHPSRELPEHLQTEEQKKDGPTS